MNNKNQLVSARGLRYEGKANTKRKSSTRIIPVTKVRRKEARPAKGERALPQFKKSELKRRKNLATV